MFFAKPVNEGEETIKFDYHIHSKYSKDSALEPRTILRVASKRGLKKIAITDHNTIKGGLETQKLNNSLIEVIVGAEIYTEKGEVIGLNLTEEIKSRKLKEVVMEIKEQGGKVFIPHPFDKIRKGSIRNNIYEIIEYIDYVEGFNGRCLLNAFNKKALNFARKYDIKVLSGSDAHYSFEIGHVKYDFFSFLKSSLAHLLTKTYKKMRKNNS